MEMIILKFRYIFLLIIIFAVSACDYKNLKKGSIVRIGVSVDTYEDKFHHNLIKGIKEAAELSEHEIELTFTDEENDIRNQIMHVKGYIDQKMDAVIVIPVNSEEASPVSNMCLDAKMKLVYLNIKPEKLPEGIYYVGPEEYEEGRIQMEYAAEKLNGSGEIGILMGELNQHAAIKRTEGIEEVLTKYPGIKVVKKQTAQFNRDMADVLNVDAPCYVECTRVDWRSTPRLHQAKQSPSTIVGDLPRCPISCLHGQCRPVWLSS